MYAMNLITLVKPYRRDVSVQSYGTAQSYMYA